MAEILLKPSSLSKIIPLSFDLNDTNASNAAQLMTKRQFNTADTDAWFQISLDDFVATAGSFDITLFNLNDKSVFNHTGKPFTTNPFYYKLDSESDETTNEIRHAGRWIGQIVVTLANGDSATRKFIFDIEGHILDGADVQTILLEDYNALIATINASKDLLAQYNVDYAALLVDLAAAETARTATYNQLVADQQANIDAFDVALDTGIVAANLATKLQTFEATNNSRLLSAEQQLADSESKRELISRKKRTVLLTFVDDDTKSTVMDRWPQIIQEKNIKMNLAVITGGIGETGSLTWQQIKDLKAMGAVPVVHCHNHIPYTTLTETELRTDMKTALSLFKANGLHSDALVYVGGAHNALVRKVTRDYFRCGVTVQSSNPANDINYPPLNQYAIRRRPLAETTYADYKAWLDLAIANNGWLVFMSHSQFAEFDATQVQYIKDLIDYARTQGVEIVTLEEGLDIYGNLLDQGDYSGVGEDYTIIDCEGNMHSTKFNQYNYDHNDALTGNDIPTTYPKNKTQINIIGYNMRTTFPESLYGILETVTGVNYYFCRQTFIPAQKDYTFTRRAISDGTAWTPWVKVITQTELDALPYQIKDINAYTEATRPSEFSTGVTVFPVNGGNPFNGLAGFVTNYKIGSGLDWYKQELRAYGSNQVFSRKTTGGDAWDVWQKISVV